MDKDITKLAHKTARMSGKSISTIVKEYFVQKDKSIRPDEVSPLVSRWFGVLKTGKPYKKLRDDHIKSRLKKYEDTD